MELRRVKWYLINLVLWQIRGVNGFHTLALVFFCAGKGFLSPYAACFFCFFRKKIPEDSEVY